MQENDGDRRAAMDAMKDDGEILDTMRIQEMIPHRYPFLMIDRLIDVVPNDRATGIKNVSINEPFFQGHFPGDPVMPGVLIIESMAQTAATLVVATLGAEKEGRLVYFMSIESARFRKPVRPGDTIFVHVEKQRNRGSVWRFRGRAEVEDVVVAEATYTAMIRDE
jgi:3-hydroxyacyl-[acyl-carrier-protein] dehydratase